MFRTTATSQKNYERFIKYVAENELVWALRNESGYAFCESNHHNKEDEEANEPVDVIMFWSHAAYAGRVREQAFSDYEVTAIELFDFIFRWLPGMSGDRVLAGPNWTGDLVGLELDPYKLRISIENQLSNDIAEKYEKLYEEAIAGKD